jgi:hypothetical protein
VLWQRCRPPHNHNVGGSKNGEGVMTPGGAASRGTMAAAYKGPRCPQISLPFPSLAIFSLVTLSIPSQPRYHAIHQPSRPPHPGRLSPRFCNLRRPSPAPLLQRWRTLSDARSLLRIQLWTSAGLCCPAPAKARNCPRWYCSPKLRSLTPLASEGNQDPQRCPGG